MQNLSDSDIDKLFRQAANDHQPSFDAADWDAMAQKLDDADRKPGYLRWVAIPLLLLTVSWLIWPGIMEQNSAESARQQTSTEHQSPPLNSNDEASVPSSPNDAQESSNTDQTATSGSKNTTSDNRLFKQKTGSSQSNPISIQSSRKASAINIQQEGIAASEEFKQPDPSSNSSISDTQTSIDSIHTGFENGNQHKYLRGMNVSVEGTPDTLMQTEHPDASVFHAAHDVKEDETKQPVFYRLAIRAMASPDYTSVRFEGSGETGFSYGMEMDYFITPRVSVSAGVLHSRKYYTANEVQYTIYDAEDLTGDCSMWDIPVNIRYTFSPDRKFTAFVSAGVSSYLLNTEQYSFDVETGYGRQHYTMDVKNGNSEWFKMFNLSVGVQRRLSDHFAVHLEPFVKLPLSGVGEGKIDITSFGCFFALHYRFLSIQK